MKPQTNVCCCVRASGKDEYVCLSWCVYVIGSTTGNGLRQCYTPLFCYYFDTYHGKEMCCTPCGLFSEHTYNEKCTEFGCVPLCVCNRVQGTMCCVGWGCPTDDCILAFPFICYNQKRPRGQMCDRDHMGYSLCGCVLRDHGTQDLWLWSACGKFAMPSPPSQQSMGEQ